MAETVRKKEIVFPFLDHGVVPGVVVELKLSEFGSVSSLLSRNANIVETHRRSVGSTGDTAHDYIRAITSE